MAICFFINFYRVDPDIVAVLRGTFIPTIPSGAMIFTIGLIGSVIMPHNLHLHSSLVLSREFIPTSISMIKEANMYNAIESSATLFVAFCINFTVIGTFAYFFFEGYTSITLESAATYLYDTFGEAAKLIWAIGLLAGGQSTVMTGTYAGQFVLEGFFEIHLSLWKRIILTRSISILPALCVCFIDDIDTTFTIINIL